MQVYKNAYTLIPYLQRYCTCSYTLHMHQLHHVNHRLVRCTLRHWEIPYLLLYFRLLVAVYRLDVKS